MIHADICSMIRYVRRGIRLRQHGAGWNSALLPNPQVYPQHTSINACMRAFMYVCHHTSRNAQIHRYTNWTSQHTSINACSRTSIDASSIVNACMHASINRCNKVCGWLELAEVHGDPLARQVLCVCALYYTVCMCIISHTVCEISCCAH